VGVFLVAYVLVAEHWQFVVIKRWIPQIINVNRFKHVCKPLARFALQLYLLPMFHDFWALKKINLVKYMILQVFCCSQA